jgi:hypothetical protein
LVSPKLVVADFVWPSQRDAVDLAKAAERLQQGLVWPALAGQEMHLVARTNQVTPDIEDEYLSTAVATLTGRIERIVCEGDDQDSHDNL